MVVDVVVAVVPPVVIVSVVIPVIIPVIVVITVVPFLVVVIPCAVIIFVGGRAIRTVLAISVLGGCIGLGYGRAGIKARFGCRFGNRFGNRVGCGLALERATAGQCQGGRCGQCEEGVSGASGGSHDFHHGDGQ